MNFAEYQVKALETDRTSLSGSDAAQLVPLLGLAGEAGHLLSEYKKRLRDGPSHVRFVDRVHEELGDILWYVANLASKYGLDLGDIAETNLKKTRARFLGVDAPVKLDGSDKAAERFPDHFILSFEEAHDGEKVVVRTYINGQMVGAALTDNAYDDDGYRFHDVFHASFAAVLGWSPVLRKLLGRKRRSDAKRDEVEDGGRAAVIEEGIAALIFDYARNHNFLDGVGGVDDTLLKTVRGMSSHLEVASQPDGLWQQAILQGYTAWRKIIAAGGGAVEIDTVGRQLRFIDPSESATATAAAV